MFLCLFDPFFKVSFESDRLTPNRPVEWKQNNMCVVLKCPVYLVAASSGFLFAAELRPKDGVTWLDLTFSAAITNPS